jgi:hypothetical protein
VLPSQRSAEELVLATMTHSASSDDLGAWVLLDADLAILGSGPGHMAATAVRCGRSAAFPADLDERRAGAADLLLIGMTLSRTTQGTSREDLRRILLRGGRIRALLLDPSDDDLLVQAVYKHEAYPGPQRLKARIMGTLDELASLRDSTSGQMEIRVASYTLTIGVNAIDTATPNGILVLQHYEHKPPYDAAPIMCLNSKDAVWFSHFLAEAERMWQDGVPWPPSPARALAQATRPSFRESFGA